MSEAADVTRFELTLFWPLRIFPPEAARQETNTKAYLDKLVQSVTSQPDKRDPKAKPIWSEVTDTLARSRQPAPPEQTDHAAADLTSFSEGVYFLPYIQRLLYGAVSRRPPFRLLTRTDIRKVQVWNNPNADPGIFDVALLDLYLFPSEVAILALRITGSNCSLQDYLTLAAWFRRSFPPFWSNFEKDRLKTKESKPGHCPYRVSWGVWKEQTEQLQYPAEAVSDLEQPSNFISHFQQHRHPRPASHWQYLLEPLQLCLGQAGNGVLQYQLLGDDRIPLQSFVALKDIRAISRGDWMRMALCESPGSWPLPYAEKFLQDFEANHCYDRFWSQEPGPPDSSPSSYPRALTTRFLVTPNSLCLAAQAASDSDHWTLSPHDGLLAHYRHHYFQLYLLAQVQHASLLVFSDQLAEAVETDQSTSYHQDIAKIAKEFARFIDRLWVGELTTQIQGMELFRLVVRQMQSERLFDQVKGEIDYVHQYLSSERAEEMARTQEQLARSQERLAKVAYWGLAAGTVVSALGMNVLVKPAENWWESQGLCTPWTDWAVFFTFLSIIGLPAWLIWSNLVKPNTQQRSDGRP